MTPYPHTGPLDLSCWEGGHFWDLTSPEGPWGKGFWWKDQNTLKDHSGKDEYFRDRE